MFWSCSCCSSTFGFSSSAFLFFAAGGDLDRLLEPKWSHRLSFVLSSLSGRWSLRDLFRVGERVLVSLLVVRPWPGSEAPLFDRRLSLLTGSSDSFSTAGGWMFRGSGSKWLSSLTILLSRSMSTPLLRTLRKRWKPWLMPFPWLVAGEVMLWLGGCDETPGTLERSK